MVGTQRRALVAVAAVVTILALKTERESYSSAGTLHELLRELTGFGAPGVDGGVLHHRLGRVYSLQPHAGAGFQKQRIAVDDTTNFMHAFF